MIRVSFNYFGNGVMSNINISMVSTDKFIFLKMRYKEYLVSTRQQITDNRPIKFPVRILLKALFRLQVKRYDQFRKKVLLSLSSFI